MLCLLRGETMDPAGIYKSHYHRGNVDYINRTSKKKYGMMWSKHF